MCDDLLVKELRDLIIEHNPDIPISNQNCCLSRRAAIVSLGVSLVMAMGGVMAAELLVSYGPIS